MLGCCLISSRPALRPLWEAAKSRSHCFNSERSRVDRSSSSASDRELEISIVLNDAGMVNGKHNDREKEIAKRLQVGGAFAGHASRCPTSTTMRPCSSQTCLPP